jgi:hypothetical protein
MNVDNMAVPVDTIICMHYHMFMSLCVDIFGDMAESVAPSISGDYTKDIKKAIACQVTVTSVTVTAATVTATTDVRISNTLLQCYAYCLCSAKLCFCSRAVYSVSVCLP